MADRRGARTPRLDQPPAAPFRPGFWRSPVRGPWLTAVFGAVLLFAIPVMFVTGLLSYASYNPGLGHNDKTPDRGVLGFFLFNWPTEPEWLYQLNQGTHVILGLVLVPVLLAKLWSVIPKLFQWPPITSPARAFERLSLLLLVGGAVFEFVTGILNIQYYYVFPGSFYTLHYYGAWVFVSAFVAHVVIKLPILRRALRSRRLRDEVRTDTAHTAPERADDTGLVSTNPARPTISRRGVLGLVGASSLTIFAVTVGQSIGGPLRRTALLAPRGADPGTGPNGFQINKTAADVGITTGMAAAWWLTVEGARRVVLSRPQLQAMRQHTAELPIACVEGWATDIQAWTGVRLRDLAALVGMLRPGSVFVQSLERGGFGSTTLRDNQILNADSLLALRVNGADLSLDHGFPARVIVPDNPGVHNTKWVTSLRFQA
jgi:DMSO/TMAO reductase YedYZ molybdopterin-dependent catalytic subunit